MNSHPTRRPMTRDGIQLDDPRPVTDRADGPRGGAAVLILAGMVTAFVAGILYPFGTYLANGL